VLVRDGKIAAVAGKLDAPAGATVIDVPGELTPGLIDPFTQQGVAGSASEISEEIAPAWRVSRAIDRRSVVWKAAVADGVTTVGLFPGSDSVWAGQGAVVGVSGSGPVVEKDEAGVLLVINSDPASRNSSRGRPDSIYNRLPTNRMGVIWMARRTLSSPTAALGRDAGVIQDVLEGRRRLFVAARTDFDIDSADRLATEYKLKPILVGGQEAWRVLPKLKERRYPVILTTVATTQGQGAIGPESTEMNWNNAGLLVGAGVPVAFAGGNVLDKARFSVRHGMPAQAALEAITKRPAELLGAGDRVGVLEMGKGADLAAFSGDPLEPTSAVLWTMKAGVTSKP
jgi:imidazolonepropionase-like amidohydrolase